MKSLASSVSLFCSCILFLSPLAVSLPALHDFQSFDQFNVIKVLPSSTHLSANDSMQDRRSRFLEESGSVIQVWEDEDSASFRLHSSGFTFHVSPHHVLRVKQSLARHRIPFSIISEDMSLMIRQQMTGNTRGKSHDRHKTLMLTSGTGDSSWSRGERVSRDFSDSYHTLGEIYAYLKQVNASHADVDLRVIGRTYEGREILAIEVGKGVEKGELGDTLVLECGVHAREWISPASCLWILDRLLDPSIHESNDLHDNEDDGGENSIFSFRGSFVIIPVMNPDGYEYTWTGNRFWRKNRSPNHFFRRCRGVDLNRNFDASFEAGSEILDSCKATYAGPVAFSELESAALRDYLIRLTTKRGASIKSYISVHSYSQLWMYPYGYTTTKTPDDKDLNKISAAVTSAMRQPFGTEYKYGSIIETIYGTATHGSSIDYAYDEMGVKYSFAVELRDQGDEGFLLHPRFIKPTAQELWLAVKTILSFI